MKKMTFGLALSAAFLLAPGRAGAQVCTVTRDQVLEDLAAGSTVDQLQEKYKDCVAAGAASLAGPGAPGAGVAVNAIASEVITNTGNTNYEALKSCGYHPQREEANCAVEIRQRFGFGGPICNSNGSHEYMLFCVDYGGGWVPVHTNGFHIHDEAFGVNPEWSFSSTIQSNPRLLSQPNDGTTLRGRVILSWAIPPAGCAAMPIWGNQSDFRFRLDP